MSSDRRVIRRRGAGVEISSAVEAWAVVACGGETWAVVACEGEALEVVWPMIDAEPLRLHRMNKVLKY